MEFIAIIIIVSLSLIIFGFVYNAKATTRKKKKLLANRINSIGQERGIKWNIEDIEQHRAIAWNTGSKTLAFVYAGPETIQEDLIDVNEIGSCQLFPTTNMQLGATKASSEKIVTRLDLQLFYKDRSKDPLSLCFYNEMVDGVYERPVQTNKATYWKELISK